MTPDFQNKVLEGMEAIARLETHMEILMGNGQPGVITKLDTRITALEMDRATNRGAQANKSVTRATRISLGSMAVAIAGVVLRWFTKT